MNDSRRSEALPSPGSKLDQSRSIGPLRLRNPRALALLAGSLGALILGERILWEEFLTSLNQHPPAAPFLLFGAASLALLAMASYGVNIRSSTRTASTGMEAAAPKRAPAEKIERPVQKEATEEPEPLALSWEAWGGQEPTVLDWFKSLLGPQRIPLRPVGPKPDLVRPAPAAPIEPVVAPVPSPVLRIRDQILILRVPAAFLLAFIAQLGLERRTGAVWVSLGLYAAAAALIAWAAWRGGFLAQLREDDSARPFSSEARLPYLAAGAIFSMMTFLTSGGNLFRASTLLFWALSLLFTVAGLWDGELRLDGRLRAMLGRVGEFKVGIAIGPWTFLLLGAFLVAGYFRYAFFTGVYPEMWSDHAEKLLDVLSILNGQYSIFFLGNTGREALQFYASALVARLFGTGISYTTLKLVTISAGFLTLPFLYLFAKEYAGRRVGWVALILAGVAYWPNVISRAGLRFPLYPLFVAPALFFLLRGLRLRRRNDLLLCGLAIGLGLYGYSPARVIPLAVLLGFGLYWIHRGLRRQAWTVLSGLSATVVLAFVLFVPLFRVAIELPDFFFFRMMTRMGTLERAYPGSPMAIFFSNFWSALRIFHWDNGTIAISSIPFRPVLDWVTAALFSLGLMLVIVRYFRYRAWQDIFILLSIPVLLLPTVLSLAFPEENPAIHRASGAIVPVFTIAALPLAALLDWADRTWAGARARIVAIGVVGLILIVAASNNYRLVFQTFLAQQRNIPWNVTEAGSVVRGFAESIGTYDTAYVVPFPHWMDTRLVGIHAGTPGRDYALWPNQFDSLVGESRSQLFLLKPEDHESLDRLRGLFPNVVVSYYDSAFEGRDFLVLLVPGVSEPLPPIDSGE